MNQKLNPEQVRQLLNSSLNRIEQPALDRLREARELALARHDARASAPVLAWAGNWRFAVSHHKARYFAAAALLAAALFGGTFYWHHEHDVSEIDVAILTDELPIEVYVD
jgi:hypothetical protein